MAHFPNADAHRRRIVSQVEASKAAARAALNGSTEEAEKALSELEVLANDFRELDFGRNAASTASDLKQNLDLRKSRLVEELRESLQQGRFSYVADYIKELGDVEKDILKREDLGRILEAARDMLHEKYEAAIQNVPDASTLANAVGVLADAAKHIGDQLGSWTQGSFIAEKKASDLKKRATKHVTGLAKKLEDALAELNFEQIFCQAAVLKEYFE
eukprot:618094-Rhodomonas_salina.1